MAAKNTARHQWETEGDDMIHIAFGSALKSFVVCRGRPRNLSEKNLARLPGIVADFQHGKTLREIGDIHNLSRERIRQLLKIGGITAKTAIGGASLVALLSVRYKKKTGRSEAKLFKLYGTTAEKILEINHGLKFTDKNSTTCKYLRQRSNAKARGIEWSISLADWWSVWERSGKWHLRGRGSGYNMTRIGDTGAYSIDNVEIKTGAENSSEAYYKHTWEDRFPGRVRRKNQTHCAHGHERTTENTYRSGVCKICAKKSSALNYQKSK